MRTVLSALLSLLLISIPAEASHFSFGRSGHGSRFSAQGFHGGLFFGSGPARSHGFRPFYSPYRGRSFYGFRFSSHRPYGYHSYGHWPYGYASYGFRPYSYYGPGYTYYRPYRYGPSHPYTAYLSGTHTINLPTARYVTDQVLPASGPAVVRANYADLIFRVEPSSALVFIDGKLIGSARSFATERDRYTILDGEHQLRIIAHGYQAFEATLDVPADRTVHIDVALEAEIP